MKAKQVRFILVSSWYKLTKTVSETSEFEKDLYNDLLKLLCKKPSCPDNDQCIGSSSLWDWDFNTHFYRLFQVLNFHTGTLLLIALVCEKFDNYGDEFTDTIMKYYTPEQLTLAKSRVDFSTDDNIKLVELLAISIESEDREEIEEKVRSRLILCIYFNRLFEGR